MAATGEKQGSTSGSAPTRPSESTYVVQVEKALADEFVWTDVAAVTVPARTKRRGIIGKALVQAGVRPEVGGEPLRVRVLDASSSAVTEVAAVQPEPQLRIGG